MLVCRLWAIVYRRLSGGGGARRSEVGRDRGYVRAREAVSGRLLYCSPRSCSTSPSSVDVTVAVDCWRDSDQGMASARCGFGRRGCECSRIRVAYDIQMRCFLISALFQALRTSPQCRWTLSRGCLDSRWRAKTAGCIVHAARIITCDDQLSSLSAGRCSPRLVLHCR